MSNVSPIRINIRARSCTGYGYLEDGWGRTCTAQFVSTRVVYRLICSFIRYYVDVRHAVLVADLLRRQSRVAHYFARRIIKEFFIGS